MWNFHSAKALAYCYKTSLLGLSNSREQWWHNQKYVEGETVLAGYFPHLWPLPCRMPSSTPCWMTPTWACSWVESPRSQWVVTSSLLPDLTLWPPTWPPNLTLWSLTPMTPRPHTVTVWPDCWPLLSPQFLADHQGGMSDRSQLLSHSQTGLDLQDQQLLNNQNQNHGGGVGGGDGRHNVPNIILTGQ